MTTLLNCQKNIASLCYCGMADYLIIVSQLGFFFKIQMMTHHLNLEKHFNVPSLPINTNNFFEFHVNSYGEYSQLIFFVAISNKNNFYLLCLFGSHNNTGKDQSYFFYKYFF